MNVALESSGHVRRVDDQCIRGDDQVGIVGESLSAVSDHALATPVAMNDYVGREGSNLIRIMDLDPGAIVDRHVGRSALSADTASDAEHAVADDVVARIAGARVRRVHEARPDLHEQAAATREVGHVRQAAIPLPHREGVPIHLDGGLIVGVEIADREIRTQREAVVGVTAHGQGTDDTVHVVGHGSYSAGREQRGGVVIAVRNAVRIPVGGRTPVPAVVGSSVPVPGVDGAGRGGRESAQQRQPDRRRDHSRRARLCR